MRHSTPLRRTLARLAAAIACASILPGAAISARASAQESSDKPAGAETASTRQQEKRPPCARPEYPRLALESGWTGVSTITFLIGEDGFVKDAKITRSSGHPMLDEAAKSALMLCQFKPARKDGKPAQAWVPVQYVWSLP